MSNRVAQGLISHDIHEEIERDRGPSHNFERVCGELRTERQCDMPEDAIARGIERVREAADDDVKLSAALLAFWHDMQNVCVNSRYRVGTPRHDLAEPAEAARKAGW